MDDTLDEDQLVFKRFPAEKQEQVRGLVNYATLMGLTGKDLVSIGGKLDRLKKVVERKANLEIIKGFNCEPIGVDRGRRDRESALDSRFKLKTPNGTYNFECDYSTWKVTSLATKQTRKHRPPDYDYELGNVYWGRRSRYSMLLDISAGKFQLNF